MYKAAKQINIIVQMFLGMKMESNEFLMPMFGSYLWFCT